MMKTRKKSISLSGPINESYTVILQPGQIITLESDASFKGIDVGGQVFSNAGSVATTFSFQEESGEVILAPVQESQATTTSILTEQDFFTPPTPLVSSVIESSTQTPSTTQKSKQTTGQEERYFGLLPGQILSTHEEVEHTGEEGEYLEEDTLVLHT